MKKILVVFTGGTIGSVAAGGTINTANAAPFKLLQLFQAQYPEADSIHFDSLQPLQILSENLAPTAWKIIIEAIESAQPDQYDGIIITHGTDTLAYTAAAMSFYFHALALPILLVSSNYPLDNPNGNGLENFICAVEFIQQRVSNGVFVPYRNIGQTMQVHRGSRLTCSLQLTGDFYSVQNNSYAEFDGRQFRLNDVPAYKSNGPEKQNGKQDSNSTIVSKTLQLKPQYSSRILMVKPYPGLDYRYVDVSNADAVLHDLYHSGTACTTAQWGDNHSLLNFLKYCQERNVLVFLAPAYQSENAYQSTRELLEHGANMIWNMSIEAAYVKLVLAFANCSNQQDIMDFIKKDFAHEHI